MAVTKKTPKKKTSFVQIHKIIHGLPGCGKTTLASQFTIGNKGPAFIASEDGHDDLPESTHIWRCEDWEDIVKLADTVEKKFSNFTFDLLSDIDLWAVDYTCEKLEIHHLTDIKFGKAHDIYQREVTNTLARFMNILPCTFLCHSADKQITENKVEYNMQVPKLQKRLFEWLTGKVDMIGFIDTFTGDEESNIIRFKPSSTAITKSRIGHMAKDFDLVHDYSDTSFKNIEKAFKAGRPKPQAQESK